MIGEAHCADVEDGWSRDRVHQYTLEAPTITLLKICLPVRRFIFFVDLLAAGDIGEAEDTFGSVLAFLATPFSLGSFFGFLLSCGRFELDCFVNWPELLRRTFRDGFSSMAGSPFRDGDCFVGRPVTNGDWIRAEL